MTAPADAVSAARSMADILRPTQIASLQRAVWPGSTSPFLRELGLRILSNNWHEIERAGLTDRALIVVEALSPLRGEALTEVWRRLLAVRAEMYGVDAQGSAADIGKAQELVDQWRTALSVLVSSDEEDE